MRIGLGLGVGRPRGRFRLPMSGAVVDMDFVAGRYYGASPSDLDNTGATFTESGLLVDSTDVIKFPLAAMGWFNDAAGTFLIQWKHGTIAATNAQLFRLAESDSNRIQAFINATTGVAGARITTAAASYSPSNTANAVTPSARNKAALRYGTGANAAGLCLNGGAVTQASPVSLPTKDTYTAGICLGNQNGTQPLDGYIERFTYFRTGLSNEQIQALTT